MLLPLLLAAANLAAWVPARWNTADVKSLDLVRGTAVNCLLLPKEHWSPAFVKAAHQQQVAVLGIGPAAQLEVAAAVKSELDGIVAEGDITAAQRDRLLPAAKAAKLAYIELGLRSALPLDSKDPVIGTYQAVWSGINVQENGEAKAAPSGAPWIDTNAGFLRFLRSVTPSVVWLGNRPPQSTMPTRERYLQVYADAAMIGARWVIALEPDLEQRLYKNDPKALQTWRALTAAAGHFEDARWRGALPWGKLSVIEDVDSGALLSGGVLDMIAVKHTPVRAVPNRALTAERLQGALVTVNVDPASLNQQQQSAVKSYLKSGGSILNGPPGWKFPPPQPGQITLPDSATKQLDEIWKEVNGVIGRRNLGARLFNVSSMLSSLLEAPDGKHVLHLVNYSDYPVDSVTVHLLNKYKKATLVAPGQPPIELKLYDNDEGIGVDIDKIDVVATIVLE